MRRSKYYVAVLIGGETKYVTDTLPNKVAVWEADKGAKAYPKTVAENICEGLNMNMIPAMVIQAPEYITLNNEKSRAEALCEATVEWFVNDCMELEDAENELGEIGFTGDELKKYGFPESEEE